GQRGMRDLDGELHRLAVGVREIEAVGPDLLHGGPPVVHARDLAGDVDEGDGLLPGGDQAGEGVGEAGAAGGDRDADLAGGEGVAAGGLHRARLVAAGDDLDLVAV